MVIRTTRWSPDTCNCILEYQWDDAESENIRTHSPSTIVNQCPIHQSLSGLTNVWNCIFDENSRKNIALQVSLDNGPITLYDLISSIFRILKSTINYNYSWSGTVPNRVLNISFTGISLTNAQKTTMRTALNTRFGTGKVVLA